jgi:hypothetical protein
MTTLVERIVAIAEALDLAGIDWAFGGALALAYATEEPRGTRDVDVNVFVTGEQVDRVFGALPDGVRHRTADRRAVRADGQVRLWWDDTPVDLFFAVDPFHLGVAGRCRSVPFAGRTIRVLAPEDLAVFKAMFNRSKDWVDIDEMAASGSLDRAVASRRLAALLGADDDRVARLADDG